MVKASDVQRAQDGQELVKLHLVGDIILRAEPDEVADARDGFSLLDFGVHRGSGPVEHPPRQLPEGGVGVHDPRRIDVRLVVEEHAMGALLSFRRMRVKHLRQHAPRLGPEHLLDVRRLGLVVKPFHGNHNPSRDVGQSGLALGRREVEPKASLLNVTWQTGEDDVGSQKDTSILLQQGEEHVQHG